MFQMVCPWWCWTNEFCKEQRAGVWSKSFYVHLQHWMSEPWCLHLWNLWVIQRYGWHFVPRGKETSENFIEKGGGWKCQGKSRQCCHAGRVRYILIHVYLVAASFAECQPAPNLLIYLIPLFCTDWSLDTSLFWKMKDLKLNVQCLRSFSVSKHPFNLSFTATSRRRRVKIHCLLSECGALSLAIALDVVRVGVRERFLTGVEANDDIEAEASFRNKYSNVRGHLYASLKVIRISKYIFFFKYVIFRMIRLLPFLTQEEMLRSYLVLNSISRPLLHQLTRLNKQSSQFVCLFLFLSLICVLLSK